MPQQNYRHIRGEFMSVLLQDLYNETKNLYGLKLIAGASGMGNAVNWVYIAESLAGPGYLNGGELILTTGVLCREDPNWLYNFVEGMIREKTCGLILNTGKYIQPEHITQEILSLCDAVGFPLFTMPWETAISAITHDYYGRLFTDSQHREQLDRTLLDLIHQRQDSSLLLSELEEYGYPVYQPYGLLYIHLANPAVGLPVSPLAQANRLCLSIEHKLRSLSLQSHLCSTDSYCIVLIPQQELHRMESAAREIRDFISLQYPSLQFSIGISSRAATLANLPRAFFHARSSAMIALARGKDLLSFDDLGIFQILLSVTDRGILRDYARRHLHAAEAYDRENQSNCTEVLHQYLLHSGSIQRIAETMYCHRNTINKKVRALRENLGYDLSDPNVRFELMLAFCIRDYLKISL